MPSIFSFWWGLDLFGFVSSNSWVFTCWIVGKCGSVKQWRLAGSSGVFPACPFLLMWRSMLVTEKKIELETRRLLCHCPPVIILALCTEKGFYLWRPRSLLTAKLLEWRECASLWTHQSFPAFQLHPSPQPLQYLGNCSFLFSHSYFLGPDSW